MDVFEHILQNCLDQDRKNIFVIYDDTTSSFLPALKKAGELTGKRVSVGKIIEAGCHGEEPPYSIVEQMMVSDAVLCLTHYSLAHTSARNQLTEKGIPFLSMPDYNSDMINNPALLTNYEKTLPLVKKYSDILSKGSVIKVYTELGTDLQLDITNRLGNCCPGLVNNEYLLGSPPDIEANVAPIEEGSFGTLVIDGSITDYRIGLLSAPVELKVVDGKIQSMQCSDENILSCVRGILDDVKSERAYYIGELGIGFNEDATICGNMLIDEGARGCIHFGMGSNWTIGGKNKVAFHLDFVMKNATVYVDNTKIIDRGVLL